MYRKCPGCGKVDILIGSTNLGFVDLNGTAGNFFALVPAFSSVKIGTVTSRVRSTGKKVKIDGLIANLKSSPTFGQSRRSPAAVRALR